MCVELLSKKSACNVTYRKYIIAKKANGLKNEVFTQADSLRLGYVTRGTIRDIAYTLLGNAVEYFF